LKLRLVRSSHISAWTHERQSIDVAGHTDLAIGFHLFDYLSSMAPGWNELNWCSQARNSGRTAHARVTQLHLRVILYVLYFILYHLRRSKELEMWVQVDYFDEFETQPESHAMADLRNPLKLLLHGPACRYRSFGCSPSHAGQCLAVAGTSLTVFETISLKWLQVRPHLGSPVPCSTMHDGRAGKKDPVSTGNLLLISY